MTPDRGRRGAPERSIPTRDALRTVAWRSCVKQTLAYDYAIGVTPGGFASEDMEHAFAGPAASAARALAEQDESGS